MPISLEKLRAVRVVVCHENPGGPCPDGLASAILLKDALSIASPDLHVVFASHGMPSHRDVPIAAGTLFCDIAPYDDGSGKQIEEHVAAGTIVLDHHPTQRDVVLKFGENGVFGSNESGESGAFLAWREAWLPIEEASPHAGRPVRRRERAAEFASKAAVRDTWKTNDSGWRSACAQAAALSFWPKEKFLGIVDPFGVPPDLDALLSIGDVLLEKDAQFVQTVLRDACCVTTHRGTRLLIVPTTKTSDVAEYVRHEGQDVVVGFGYRAEDEGLKGIKMVLSCRSRAVHGGGEYDVGKFCKHLGGGGHRGAAGATIDVGPKDLNPYATILKIFDDYEF